MFDLLKDNGIQIDDTLYAMAEQQELRKSKKVDNTRISKIELIPDSKNVQLYVVSLTLSTSFYTHLVFVTVNDNEYQAARKNPLQEVNKFYATIFIDLATALDADSKVLIRAYLKDVDTGKVTYEKAGLFKLETSNSNEKKREVDGKENKLIGMDECALNFNKISAFIFKNEGGYVDDPNDKGGKTNKGISWRTWLAYAKIDLNLEPTVKNLKNITDEDAKIIYKKRYWEANGFCIIKNLKVALMFYDWTITSGGARKKFAKLLIDEYDQDISTDKNIGENICHAINNIKDQNKLLKELTDLRKDYYIELAYKTNKDGTFKKDNNGELIQTSDHKFLKGWLNRVENCFNIVL